MDLRAVTAQFLKWDPSFSVLSVGRWVTGIWFLQEYDAGVCVYIYIHNIHRNKICIYLENHMASFRSTQMGLMFIEYILADIIV